MKIIKRIERFIKAFKISYEVSKKEQNYCDILRICEAYSFENENNNIKFPNLNDVVDFKVQILETTGDQIIHLTDRLEATEKKLDFLYRDFDKLNDTVNHELLIQS